MPVHDWSRVSAGTFHDFHCSWIITIKNALNNGVLPADFYAQAEQRAGILGPDVLTLQTSDSFTHILDYEPGGATALATAPPKVRFSVEAEAEEYTKKQRTLVIRHSSNDKIIAMIEILSPGNKDDKPAVRSVVKKVLAGLKHGYHFLLIDILPQGPGDPRGIHGAIWARISKPHYRPPVGKPLTLVSYVSKMPFAAYIEPLAVGDTLTSMPLFLKPGWYVQTPLEVTYKAAFETLPRQVRETLAVTTAAR